MATSIDQVPRQRYARGEGERLRDDLLAAAAELMATHGNVEAISLRAVAREAGVSPTAVYRHFDDHLDLLRETVDACWTNFLAAIRVGAESSPDPFVAFRATGDAYVKFAMEHQGQYRVLFGNQIDLAYDGSATGLDAFQVLVQLVTGILAANDDPRDPFFVSVQVNTWIHGIVDLCGCNPDMPWPDIDVQIDGLSSALGLRPADAERPPRSAEHRQQ
jgi:AcrR family transcriptional regulator